MMWYRIKTFISFYFQAITKYNVHSAFVHDFVLYVLDTDKEYYIFDPIEDERKLLLRSNEKLNITDHGAGASGVKQSTRTVREIAKKSLSSPNKLRMLFNLVHNYPCDVILELGTSLGISSAYLASANIKAKVITIEGDPAIANIAASIHESLGLSNIDMVVGQFDHTLAKFLKSNAPIDIAYLDGNHKKEPTLEYFNKIAHHMHHKSIVVIDDIYWSEEMTEAWHVIINDPRVTLSIDMYDIGIVFFNTSLSKQHIKMIPYKYKPWKIGIFA